MRNNLFKYDLDLHSPNRTRLRLLDQNPLYQGSDKDIESEGTHNDRLERVVMSVDQTIFIGDINPEKIHYEFSKSILFMDLLGNVELKAMPKENESPLDQLIRIDE